MPAQQNRAAKLKHRRLALAVLLLVGAMAAGSSFARANVADTQTDQTDDQASSEDDGDRDAIVGSWVGQAAQPDQDPFEVRLTFVSPKGGVSRYPSEPSCGGVLNGNVNGDHYDYQEMITFGGAEDVENGCLDGKIRVTVNGDTLKFDWSSTANGEMFTSSGELRRQGGARTR